LHFLSHCAGRAEIKVHAVLCRFCFWYRVEPHVRTTPARGLDLGFLSCSFLVHVGSERLRPELGNTERVGAVECHRLDEGHERTLARCL